MHTHTQSNASLSGRSQRQMHTCISIQAADQPTYYVRNSYKLLLLITEKEIEAISAYMISNNKRECVCVWGGGGGGGGEGGAAKKKMCHSHMQCETWTGRKGMGVWQNCHPG